MSRLAFLNEDLRGQTLASAAPDQHLVQGCTLDLTTHFVGRWEGSDFLGNTGPADYSGVETYACYWRGNTDMGGSLWPANIGHHLHYQPIGTIIKDAVAGLPVATQARVRAVGNRMFSAALSASWDTSKALWWDGQSEAIRDELKAAFRQTFSPYYKLAAQFEELVRALEGGRDLWTPPVDLRELLVRTFTWPDGATVTLEADALPPLPEQSRYAISRWAEGQADAQRPGPHHAFVYSIRPMVAMAFTEPDGWLRGLGGV